MARSSNYEWKSPGNNNPYKKIIDNNCIYKFLIGLSIEFNEVRKNNRQNNIPLISEAFSKVRKEKSHRNVMIRKKNFDGSIENSTLVAFDANVSWGPFQMKGGLLKNLVCNVTIIKKSLPYLGNILENSW